MAGSKTGHSKPLVAIKQLIFIQEHVTDDILNDGVRRERKRYGRKVLEEHERKSRTCRRRRRAPFGTIGLA